MKEKNIRELAKRIGLITVEDMCQYTIAQLVVMIANKVNELIDGAGQFETDVDEVIKTQNEKIQYLLGEGLLLEVENIFDGWLQDGTFDTLINQTALKRVNERIDETNAQLSDVNEKTSDFTYSYSMSKNKDYLWEWFGIKQINFIGDSITHGANASNLDTVSWSGIIKSSLLNKYGSLNQGFEKLYLSMSNEAQSKMDGFHKVENYNFNVIHDGSNIAQSKYVGVEGASLIITPKSSTKFQIVYQGLANGGTFTVTTNQNYANKITVNTSVSSNTNMPYYSQTMTVNKGDSIIIENVTGTVEILGVLYFHDRDDLFINNYGRSGAKLVDVNDEVLQMWSQAQLSFFALGHNDSFYPECIEEFKSKITKMIGYYKSSKSYVVVLDFLWTLPKSNPFREELQRLAKELKMPYISFTEELYGSGEHQKWIDGGFLSDASHPSKTGHQIIADVICQRLSLPCSINRYENYRIGTFNNTGITKSITTLKRNDNIVNGFVEVVGKRDSITNNNKLLTIMSDKPLNDVSFYGFAVGKKSAKTVYEVIGFSVNTKGELIVYGIDAFDVGSTITLQVNISYTI